MLACIIILFVIVSKWFTVNKKIHTFYISVFSYGTVEPLRVVTLFANLSFMFTRQEELFFFFCIVTARLPVTLGSILLKVKQLL